MQSLIYICNRFLGQRLTINTTHGTCQVALLHDCTHNHYFVEFCIILKQGDAKRSRVIDLYLLSDKADVRDCQFISLAGFHLEVSVKVGHCSVTCARHNDTGTNNGFTRSILHVTRDGCLRHHLTIKAKERHHQK